MSFKCYGEMHAVLTICFACLPQQVSAHFCMHNLQRLDIIYLLNPFVFGTNICTSLPTENGFAWLPKSIQWIRHICHLALQYICLFLHNSTLKLLFKHFNYSQALRGQFTSNSVIIMYFETYFLQRDTKIDILKN